jgi:DNA-binding Lrp family transcriptional regulator
MNGAAGLGWTFLSNHAVVLLCIAAEPEVRMRDIALRVGITERAVQRIIAELSAEGYLRVTRVGRRNQYEEDADRPMRHPVEARRTVGQLVELGVGTKAKKK